MIAPRAFPLKAWYAAAWSHEIVRELAARTICAKNIVLFRRTDGEVAALEDACWTASCRCRWASSGATR